MKKYWQILRNSWLSMFAYRANFIFWRIRIITDVLIGYFLWTSIFSQNKTVFGYSESHILTYIILISFTVGIVMSTVSYQVAYDIAYGRINTYLIRPVNFFFFLFSRDIANKVINSLFSFIEISVLFILLRPPFFLQNHIELIVLYAISLLLASILYFEINMLLSFIAFWSFDTWSLRFIFTILITFLGGMFFPLDILPVPIYKAVSLLPFAYLIFFPIKIYLGNVNTMYLVHGFIILIFWIIVLGFSMKKMWKKGLKIYTAQGI